MNFLLKDAECKSFPESQLGGKAYQLGLLRDFSTRNGFEVPPWCVLTAGELDKRRSGNGVILSEADKTEIRAWLKMYSAHNSRFIVRSSMIGEDGSENSFAGQLESFPCLSSDESVFQAISDCVASAGALRVQSYMAQAGLSSNQTSQVAVIVQVMIDADRSGVLFTADPKDGNRRRFLISSAFGACEAVVGGQFDCDEYEIDAHSLELKTRLAVKTRALRFGLGGLVESAVSIDQQKMPSLSGEDLGLLTDLGKKLTACRGRPLDIEWVMRGHHLYVVQMRPITKLTQDRSTQQTFIFDNSNIQESFNGLTLPLTFTYASEAYFKVYRQIMSLMGFSRAEIAQHDRRHEQMLALVKGRVYYNINSWYEGLLLLPSFGRNKADMEKMMGLEQPVDLVVDQELSGQEKLRRLPGMIRLLFKLGFAFSRIDRNVERFRRDFHSVLSSFDRSELQWMSPQQIMVLHGSLKTQILEQWGAPILNDFFVMMMAGRVRRTLVKIAAESRLPDLLAGEDLESTRPTKAMIQIAGLIRENPRVRNALLSGSESQFFDSVTTSTEIQTATEAYIEEYGDRVIGELKLETETLRQNRGFLVRCLRSYVTDDSLNLEGFNARQLELRSKAETEIFKEITLRLGKFALSQFKRDLTKFRKGVTHREAMRLDRARSFGIFRSIYLALGEKLAEQGFLDSARDVFYLRADEIDDFYHGKSLFDDPRPLVAIRKQQYLDWEKEKPAPQIKAAVPLRELPRPKAARDSATLQGLGCYPGLITGEVVVVDDPATAQDLKGKILIAERTDPGWTPLFLQAKGLIVERGSMLSHSAVVARELGLPTVVGVPHVCEILKTGDRVSLDGQTGAIQRLTTNTSRASDTELSTHPTTSEVEDHPNAV